MLFVGPCSFIQVLLVWLAVCRKYASSHPGFSIFSIGLYLLILIPWFEYFLRPNPSLIHFTSINDDIILSLPRPWFSFRALCFLIEDRESSCRVPLWIWLHPMLLLWPALEDHPSSTLTRWDHFQAYHWYHLHRWLSKRMMSILSIFL